MNKIKFNLLLFCLFSVFTQGMWERIFFFAPEIGYAVDISIALFIFYRFRFDFKVPGSNLFIALVLLGFFIGFANGDSVVDSFLYLRHSIFFVLIYNQLFTLNIDDQKWRKILNFLLFLIIIQGLGAMYNIFVLGERVEGFVGLMSSLGGTTATAFPLFITSITLLYFLFKPQLGKKELLIFLTVLCSVLLVSYSSGKRAIYFSLPFFLLITTVLAVPSLLQRNFFKKKIFGIGILAVSIFPLVIFGIENSRGLNYALSGNESSYEVISNALKYAEKYEDATDQYGHTTGRSNTSTQIMDESFKDFSLLVAGKGYGATKSEKTFQSLGFVYGVVGFTRDIISGGWFLMTLTFLLYTSIMLKNRSYQINFTTALRRLLFLLFIYIHFFYSSDFTVHLKLSLILAVLVSLINSPYHSAFLEGLLKKQNITS